MPPAPDTFTMNSEAIGGDGYDEETLKRVIQAAEWIMDNQLEDPVPDDMKGNNPCTEVMVGTTHLYLHRLWPDRYID